VRGQNAGALDIVRRSGTKTGDVMTLNSLRGALGRVLAGLVLASSLAACGSSDGDAPVPTALSISTNSLPGGQVGASYSASLAATGGTSPYHWALASGELPAGLTLAASGAITGTPSTAAGAAAIDIQVTDSGTPAQTSTRSLTLTIAPKALSVSTSSLPQGQVGVSYSTALTATGGTAPYQWALASGTLPAGLTLSAGGEITGTPAAAANAAALDVRVTDSGSPAQSATHALSLTIAASTSPPLTVTTMSLPGAQVGKAYTARLTATGGTSPLTWSITSGSLPAGLSLTPSSGVIAGTPTAAVGSVALTFAVVDSSNPAQQKSVNLTLSVASASITVAIAPRAAALTLGQTASLKATTNDPLGVTWSLSPAGGSFAPMQSTSGSSTTFTAPSTAGAYTITATSVTNPALSSSIALGVTALAGVFTYRNDSSRDGVNAQEYALTPGTGGSVGAGTFGKLFSCIADGALYAEPLWSANLTINGATHNVVFVASAHDSLFAFDADANPCVQLWSVSLIDTAHGAASATEAPVSSPGVVGSSDIRPEVGVIGTPVIDSSSGTLYVVSKSMDSTGTYFYQRLHAIDVTTGNEKTGSPILIQGTYPGTGDNTTTTTFSALYENQRCGLALVNGVIYIAWASHGDNPPYYGWVMGYTYGSAGFTQVAVRNVTPNVQYGGIWMGGSAPSADASGHLYVITGNGTFDAHNASVPNNDYGDSLLEFAPAPNSAAPDTALSIYEYFTPEDQASDESGDRDFGAGGAAVLANVTSGTETVGVVVGGGKDGSLYILNQAALGGYNGTDAGAWQKIPTGYPIFSTVAMWNDTIYLGSTSFNWPTVEAPLTSYALNTSTTPSSFVQQAQATPVFGFPGPSPAISATGTSNGVVWALDNHAYCTTQSKACGPAVLYAYDATSLVELWDSSMAAGGADAAGNAVKFTVPTIANGKVYIGTRGNNTGGALNSTSVSGELDVYGLQPN
jgi:hypothetical protein